MVAIGGKYLRFPPQGLTLRMQFLMGLKISMPKYAPNGYHESQIWDQEAKVHIETVNLMIISCLYELCSSRTSQNTHLMPWKSDFIIMWPFLTKISPNWQEKCRRQYCHLHPWQFAPLNGAKHSPWAKKLTLAGFKKCVFYFVLVDCC